MLAIRDLFSEWQRELRLQDWNIQHGIRSQLEMGSDHGRVSIYPLKTCAFVSILNPEESEKEEVEPFDIEVAIVHELLHVVNHSLSFDEGTAEHLCLENAIHHTSTLLVRMKRRIRELETTLGRRKKAA